MIENFLIIFMVIENVASYGYLQYYGQNPAVQEYYQGNRGYQEMPNWIPNYYYELEKTRKVRRDSEDYYYEPKRRKKNHDSDEYKPIIRRRLQTDSEEYEPVVRSRTRKNCVCSCNQCKKREKTCCKDFCNKCPAPPRPRPQLMPAMPAMVLMMPYSAMMMPMPYPVAIKQPTTAAPPTAASPTAASPTAASPTAASPTITVTPTSAAPKNITCPAIIPCKMRISASLTGLTGRRRPAKRPLSEVDVNSDEIPENMIIAIPNDLLDDV